MCMFEIAQLEDMTLMSRHVRENCPNIEANRSYTPSQEFLPYFHRFERPHQIHGC